MRSRPQALTEPTVEIGSWPSKKKDQKKKFKRLLICWQREHESFVATQAGKHPTARTDFNSTALSTAVAVDLLQRQEKESLGALPACLFG